MDEKLLEEIRRQEAMFNESEESDAAPVEEESVGVDDGQEDVPRSAGQQTLMGYGSDA